MILEEITHRDYRWLNIKEPDQEMVDFLGKDFHFHPLDLEDILSKVQYPKIDAYQDYLFVMLQFPVYQASNETYKRDELNVFLGKNYLITINSGQLSPLQKFADSVRTDPIAREKYMGRGVAHLLYEVIDSHMDNMFPIVNAKNDLIFRLEEEIFETSTPLKDMIQEIMILKRNIINIRRILAPQRSIITDLGTKYRQFIPEDLAIYFDDAVDKKDKILNQLDTALAYVDVLEDANEALLTRSTNRVIKTLTVFSVIMLPLTIVTGYFGMNVPLPFQGSGHAIATINGILIGVAALMILYFLKKRWL